MVNRLSRQSSFTAVQLQGRAAVKRQNLTNSEAALWQYLHGSKLGVAFRRQVPLANYIVDFLAPSVRLIVEVDGLWHQRRIALDERRERVQKTGHLYGLGPCCPDSRKDVSGAVGGALFPLRLVRAATQSSLLEGVKDAKHIVDWDVGHFVHNDKPQMVETEIESFVARIRARGAPP